MRDTLKISFFLGTRARLAGWGTGHVSVAVPVAWRRCPNRILSSVSTIQHDSPTTIPSLSTTPRQRRRGELRAGGEKWREKMATYFTLNTGARIPSVGLGTYKASPGVVADAITAAVKVFAVRPSFEHFLICSELYIPIHVLCPCTTCTCVLLEPAGSY